MSLDLILRTALTGGTDGTLDNYPVASCETGKPAIVFVQGAGFYSYMYDETETGAESSPNIIIPDDNASGTGAWVYLSSIVDHGTLIGLGDDDHPQYIKNTEFTQNSGVLVGTGAGTFIEEAGDTLRASLGVQIGVDVQAYIKHNFAATGAPTANDDTSVEYQVGSVWIDTSASPREAYLCVDATAGAAVWVNTSLEIGDLGTMAEQDKNNVDITGGDIDADTVDFTSEYDNGVVSANATIDWANGNDQKITLGASITLTFSNMGVGHKQLKVIQDATGGRIPTLPAGKWPSGIAGAFSTAAGAEDILNIYYDGASYYFQLVKGWS
jgi:hypothetical protein